ncbi:MAG: DUF1501 domain-containing protein, partial [Planctomyces sp.]
MSDNRWDRSRSGLAEQLLARRRFVFGSSAGFAGLATASLLAQDSHGPLLPHRAKHCIFLYMYGGPSQMDLFDYKPELQKRDGQAVQIELRRREVREGRLLGSRRRFRQHGDSGLWCSDALPRLSQHMDKLAVVKSLWQDSFAHGSANLQMNCGRIVQGYPSLGSWLNYGLGRENQNLPGYVVMLDPRGGPIPGAPNWSAGFMEAQHQGTVFRTSGQAVLDLQPHTQDPPELQRRQLQTLQSLDQTFQDRHPESAELRARMASYELAFQLQASAPEALDLSTETRQTLEMYGLFDSYPAHRLAAGPAVFGRQCLIARRLIERGVRFVQIYSGGGHQQQNWDAHFGVEENLTIHCPEVDRPMAGLLQDLEQRGLLDETLIVWGGEFGRTPFREGRTAGGAVLGRDHYPDCFSLMLAGGGFKKGFSYG